MIAERHTVDAGRAEFAEVFWRYARSRRAVFSVGDHKVNAIPFSDCGKQVAHNLPTGRSDDVTKMKDSHVDLGCFACVAGQGATDNQRAVSENRDSRTRVTLISPGYVSRSSNALAISRQILAAASSVVSRALTITRNSRPA